MTRLLLILFVAQAMLFSPFFPQTSAAEADAEPSIFGRSLVAYFSRWDNSEQKLEDIDALTMASVLTVDGIPRGTTSFVAEQIAEQVKGQIYSILTVDKLPRADDVLVEQNHEEQQQGTVLSVRSVPDVSAYDTIFLGFPIWAMSVPQAVMSWLDTIDLKNKTLVLFCTHNGWGAGRARAQIQTAHPEARMLSGILSIDSANVGNCSADVRRYLRDLETEL